MLSSVSMAAKSILVFDSTKRRSPVARNRRIRLSNAAEQQELKTEKARERLQLNQTRNEPLALGANREIDHVKIRVFRFIWNFQCLWHGRCRVPCELLRARESDNLIRRACDFICELERQKNGRFGDAKIRRPFFGFIHA